jgi:hypothetical protein
MAKKAKKMEKHHDKKEMMKGKMPMMKKDMKKKCK